MPFSNSNDFDQTEQTIIQDALVLCGGLEDDELPSPEQQVYARRSLNRMIKAWSRKGLKAWCWNEVTLNLVASQASYSIGPTGTDLVTERPLSVRNVRKIITGTEETPVRIMSRAEYMNQPSKDSDGEPVAVFYDPSLTNGTLYVWPSPLSTYTLKFSAQQYIEDFDSATNNPYLPVEWLQALVTNLAYRLCPKYEVSGRELELLREQAKEDLYEAENSDQEEGSLYLAPEIYS